MNKLQTVYNLLGINNKLPDESVRFLYLTDYWGLNQKTIGQFEGKSQQWASNKILKARATVPHQDVVNAAEISFLASEIKYLQFLPRDVLNDVQVIAFVNDILKIEVFHPFFLHFDHASNLRIAALYALGIPNNHLMKMYGKTQAAISMMAKRYGDRAAAIERNNRYDNTSEYKLAPKVIQNKFIKAGGTY